MKFICIILFWVLTSSFAAGQEFRNKPAHFSPEVIEEKLKERSIPQRIEEAVLPVVISNVLTFIPSAFKRDQQAGMKTSLTPKELFRGFRAHAVEIPGLVILMGVGQSLSGNQSDGESSAVASVGAGVVAGMASSLYSGPMELVKTLQRSQKKSAGEVLRSVRKAHGWRGMFLGTSAAMVEEAIDGVVMFGIPPLIQNYLPTIETPTFLKPYLEDFEDDFLQEKAAIAASTALLIPLSHPFDAIQGEIQRNALHKKPPSMKAAYANLRKQNAVMGGIVPRVIEHMAAFIALDILVDIVSAQNTKENAKKLGVQHNINKHHMVSTEKAHSTHKPLWKKVQQAPPLNPREPLWKRVHLNENKSS